MKRIDHAEASSKFIKATDHLDFHDKRLWDLRKKRDRVSEALPEWEQLRALASAIKEHTLTHLAEYLEEFERNAIGNGARVHWAKDAAEHNQIVFDIMNSRNARTLVKAKSMLTDECEMRPFLEKRGIEVMETDLGERIQQLDDEPPSHIVVPAVHKLRGDVARVFADTIGTDRNNDDPHYLTERQRQHTRPYFLRADAGMTGANFAVAETGTVVVCTNEGNADAGPFGVMLDWLRSGEPDETVPFAGLGAGEEGCVDTPPPPEFFDVEAIVDVDDDVFESDESNNVGTYYVPIP